MLAKVHTTPRTAARRAVGRAFPLAVLAVLAVLVGTAGAAQAQVKVGVIDVQKVISDSQLGKQAQTELEKFQADKKVELEAKSKEVEALKAQIEAGRLTLAQDKLAELAEQFQLKGKDLQRAETDANEELQRRGNKLMGDIEKKILPVIDEVGKADGYTIILNKFRSGLLFATESVDITGQVIQKLDAQAAAGS